MFLQTEELKSALYHYQAAEIAENDSDMLLWNIDAAVSEVKSYLRTRYDTDRIFTAEGSDRNALVLELTKNIAVWYIIRLSSVDIIYQQAEKRYTSAIDWLTKAAAGDIAPDLPAAVDEKGDVATKFRFGSLEKFDSSF
jgi:phage gp36-like protein